MTNPNSHNTGADENPLSPEAVPASGAETPKTALERIAVLQRKLKEDAAKLASESPDTGRKTESASEKAAEVDPDSVKSEYMGESTRESSNPPLDDTRATWGFYDESLHQEAPKTWYRKAWEFFTFGGATQLSAEELFGSRANQNPLLKVRKAMSKGTILPAIATAGKTLEGGLTGLAVGKVEMLAAENALNAALVYGGGIGSNILAPIGGAGLLPIASLGARRLYAWNRYEQAVNDKYEETKNDQLKIVDGVSKVENRDFADQDTEQKFLNDQERVKNESHHKSPVDTIEEKDFIQLMAKHARCSPPEVPYLQSADRYAKYCFVKFTKACEELKDRKDLTERQRDILHKYFLEQKDIDDGKMKQSEMLDVMKSLWEVSVEYGKLLAYEHKKTRDASLISQSFGSAIMATPFLGAAPLAVAGLFTGARKFYLSRVKPKNIEFDEHGRLRVRINPLLEEEGVDDPKSLYFPSIFKRELGETQITDSHKYWMDKMSFENVNDVSSERELAARLEEDALKQLVGVRLPAPKVTDDDKKKARLDFDDEQKEWVNVKEKLRKCDDDLRFREKEKMEIETLMVELENIPGDRAKENLAGKRAKLSSVNSRIQELEKEKEDLAEELVQQTEKRDKAKTKWHAIEYPSMDGPKLSSSTADLFTLAAYKDSEAKKKLESEVESKTKALERIKTLRFKKEEDPDALDIETLQFAFDDASKKFEASKDPAARELDPDYSKQNEAKTRAEQELDLVSEYLSLSSDINKLNKDIERSRQTVAMAENHSSSIKQQIEKLKKDAETDAKIQISSYRGMNIGPNEASLTELESEINRLNAFLSTTPDQRVQNLLQGASSLTQTKATNQLKKARKKYAFIELYLSLQKRLVDAEAEKWSAEIQDRDLKAQKIGREALLGECKTRLESEFGDKYKGQGKEPTIAVKSKLDADRKKAQANFDSWDTNESGNAALGKIKSEAKEKLSAFNAYTKAKQSRDDAKKALEKLESSEKAQLKKSFETIREAFAKKVKDKWKEMEGQKAPGMRKAAGQAMKNMAKNSGKTLAEKGVELAVEVIKPVAGVALAYGALNVVGAGSVVSGVSTFLSPTLVFGTAAAIGLYKFGKKRIDGIAGWVSEKLSSKPEATAKAEKPAESTSKAKDTPAK